MHLYECYRLLGLPRNASSEDVKAAYRRLARKYHPDVNQNDPKATEKFREIQEAYRMLREVGDNPTSRTAYKERYQQTAQVKVEVVKPTPPPKVSVQQPAHSGSGMDREQKLKLDLLKRVQELLRQKRIVATIPIVEGLRERFPHAPEVIHWQAIAYYRWGSELLIQGRLKEAKVYLNKVLETDPKNRELCFEAKRDLERIANSTGQ